MKDMQENAGIKLFALNSNQELAEKIAEEMGVELCDASVKHFSDGEIQININESVMTYSSSNQFLIRLTKTLWN